MKIYLYSIFLGFVLGCGPSGMTPEEKLALLVPDAKKTVPVTGQVLVDGQTIEDIWVYLIPKGEKRTKDAMPASRGRTDSQGKFAITTYMEADGAPAGDYVVCFEWLRFRQTGGMWIGPDQLGKKYADPQQSTFDVTVEDKAVTLPVFELTAQGVAKSRS